MDDVLFQIVNDVELALEYLSHDRLIRLVLVQVLAHTESALQLVLEYIDEVYVHCAHVVSHQLIPIACLKGELHLINVLVTGAVLISAPANCLVTLDRVVHRQDRVRPLVEGSFRDLEEGLANIKLGQILVHALVYGNCGLIPGEEGKLLS